MRPCCLQVFSQMPHREPLCHSHAQAVRALNVQVQLFSSLVYLTIPCDLSGLLAKVVTMSETSILHSLQLAHLQRAVAHTVWASCPLLSFVGIYETLRDVSSYILLQG